MSVHCRANLICIQINPTRKQLKEFLSSSTAATASADRPTDTQRDLVFVYLLYTDASHSTTTECELYQVNL